VRGELLVELIGNLDTLLQKNILKDKFITIFGANAPATTIFNYLEKHDISVSAVVDNNDQLVDKNFMGLKVTSPEYVLKAYKEEAIILIASKYYEEMKLQLEGMGYEENRHLLKVLNLNENIKFDTSVETFQHHREKVQQGLLVYKEIRKKHGECILIMCPVRPTGDVYMICSYLNAYHNKFKNNKIVFTVIGNVCESVANLFNISNIEKLTGEQSDYLAAYAHFLPDKIKVINPYTSHLELFDNMDGFNGIDFLDNIKYGLLGLTNNDGIVRPREHVHNKEVVCKLFEDYGLEDNNTVILAPYAHSIPQIKWDIWEKLTYELIAKNYVVVTNCGNESEKPIKGTKPIYFSFQDAVAVTEKAGFLIAYRSGFCEIIAQSNCKKVVIYPDHSVGFDSIRNFFGMEHELYRQEGLIQLEHSYDTTDELLGIIMDQF